MNHTPITNDDEFYRRLDALNIELDAMEDRVARLERAGLSRAELEQSAARHDQQVAKIDATLDRIREKVAGIRSRIVATFPVSLQVPDCCENRSQ